MLGQETEFGTVITEELIESTQLRILELESKEEEWEKTLAKLED
jgi:hypothetical protein